MDRVGDIVDPLGAKFTLPMPLLWQHRHDEPVGHVAVARATKEGITVKAKLAKIDEPGELLVIKGIPRVNPLCAVERDQQAALVRCLRNLNLDIEPLRDGPGRPEGLRWAGKEKW